MTAPSTRRTVVLATVATLRSLGAGLARAADKVKLRLSSPASAADQRAVAPSR